MTTLLFVDSNEADQEFVKDAIRDSAYTLLTAKTAADAMVLLQTKKIDVVASAVDLPDMPGIEFLSMAQEQLPNTERVLLGSYDNARDILQAINDGVASHFCSKPYEEDVLRHQIFVSSWTCEVREENTELKARITNDRKLVEQELGDRLAVATEEFEQLKVYCAILDSLPVPVVAMNRNWRAIYTNRELSLSFPSLAQLKIGLRVDEFLPATAVANIRYALDMEMRTAGDPFELESSEVQFSLVPVIHGDNDWIIIVLHELTPLFGPGR
jgi:CheY-like chemotaxis protein